MSATDVSILTFIVLGTNDRLQWTRFDVNDLFYVYVVCL